MKKKIIVIFFVMMLMSSIYAFPVLAIIVKPPCKNYLNGVEWARTYGGDEFDMFLCVQQTIDYGFITCGSYEISNSYYPLLLKLNSIGDEEWRWTITQIYFDGTHYDIDDVYPIFCNQVSDGGYLLCLWIDLIIEGMLHTIAGLFKYNEQGQQSWSVFYPEDFDWELRPISFIEVDDGYVVTGTSGSSDSYMGDMAALWKIDKSGDEQWRKEYDFGSEDDRMEAVCQTNDGGYILTGWCRDKSYDYWMIKTDEYGNEQWNKTYGGSYNDYAHTKTCYQTSDGGYLMCGFSSSYGMGNSDIWIVKTDILGNMVWNKTYGGTNKDVCWDIESVDDDGFVFITTMNYGRFSGDKDDINLVKIDSDGNIEWVQAYDGPDIQIGTSLDKTHDEGYIVSGCTGAFHSSKSDSLLIKFSPLNNQRPVKPTINGPSRGKPNTEYTFTASATDPDGDQVAYMWDWGDGNFTEGTESESYTWTSEAVFKIRVMAIDGYAGESDWSDPLSFSTPKNKPKDTLLFRLIENHPILNQLIQRFLSL